MATSLENLYEDETFQTLLRVDNSAGVDGTLRTVSDGEGTDSGLQLSTAGFGPVAGKFLFRTVSATVSAAGTDQAGATALTNEVNRVTTVAAGAGARLPTAVAGMAVPVFSDGANALKVYPATGAAIDALSTNAAHTLAVGEEAIYFALSSTLWLTIKGLGVIAAFTSGTMDGVAIGNSSRSTAKFTTVEVTTSLQLGGASSDNNLYRVFNVAIASITAYSTVLTVEPSGTAGSYTRAIVRVRAGGSTGGVGNGATIAEWYIDIADGAPTAGTISTAVTSGSGAPLVRVDISGNAARIQLRSSDGSGSFGGDAVIEVILPKPEGNSRTWTVTP